MIASDDKIKAYAELLPEGPPDPIYPFGWATRDQLSIYTLFCLHALKSNSYEELYAFTFDADMGATLSKANLKDVTRIASWAAKSFEDMRGHKKFAFIKAASLPAIASWSNTASGVGEAGRKLKAGLDIFREDLSDW